MATASRRKRGRGKEVEVGTGSGNGDGDDYEFEGVFEETRMSWDNRIALHTCIDRFGQIVSCTSYTAS